MKLNSYILTLNIFIKHFHIEKRICTNIKTMTMELAAQGIQATARRTCSQITEVQGTCLEKLLDPGKVRNIKTERIKTWILNQGGPRKLRRK